MQTAPSPLKAIFLDMDETLCDTSKANKLALSDMASKACKLINADFDGAGFAQHYLQGIYRELSPSYTAKLLPITDEESFRQQLIQLILIDMGETLPLEQSISIAKDLQHTFDEARTQYFDFFDNIEALLTRMRQHYQLVVITNGPEFSQVAKVERVNLSRYVDHIIIG
ncbi:MAG: HAD family hydrolase, partial [Sinobacterium sp.]|nr:HAD family hydrolase [Sinobacterium sp.]